MAKEWHKYRHSYWLFGQKVRELRERLGWSVRQLGRATGLNPGTVRKVEGGIDPLRPEKREVLTRTLVDASEAQGIVLMSRRDWFKLAGLEVVGLAVAQDETVSVSIAGEQGLGKAGAGITVVKRDNDANAAPARQSAAPVAAEQGSYEEQARAAHRNGEWAKAELLRLLQAGEAAQAEDWQVWAQATVAAGEQALNLGKFGEAQTRLQAVLRRAEHEVGLEAHAEALLRLGWVYYEQEQYDASIAALTRGQARVEKLLRLRDGDQYIQGLQETGLHFLGRALGERACLYSSDSDLGRATQYLDAAFAVDKEYGSPFNMGFDLLRQVPLLEYQGEEKRAQHLFGQAEELLRSPWNDGHIYLHRAMLAKRAGERRDFLEGAVRGFTSPVFYPRGLSEVLLEIAQTMDEAGMAFKYALLAAVLHPYGRSLEEVGYAANSVYNDLRGERRAFSLLYRNLLDSLTRMDEQPFALLKSTEYGYDPGSGSRRIEEAIPKVRRALRQALPPPARDCV